MSYNIEIKGLAQLKKNFAKSPATVVKELTSAIKQSIHIIRPMMVKEAPHDKGGLRKNIYARQVGLTGFVGPDLNANPYALYVHSGTGIYAGKGRIYPRKSSVLVFKIGGKTIFAKSIKGQKPNPFVDRTAKMMTPIVQKIFEKSISNILNKLAK